VKLDGLPPNVAKSYQDMRAEVTRLQQENAKLRGGTGTPTTSETPPDPTVEETPAEAPEKPAQPDPAKPEAKPPKTADEAAQEAATAAGVDLNPYSEEYATTGDVTEENRAKIAESLKGVLGENARQIVDEFIESKKVVHQNDRTMYMEAAGGEEAYQTMVNWAAQGGLPKEQIEAYNKQIGTGDRHATLFAIEGLRAKYEAANGRAPKLLGNTLPPSNGSVSPFRSSAEMTQAMADPRYKKDIAYREEVKKRLAVSPF